MSAGVCKNGHPLTQENTYVTPSTGRRECWTCKKERERRFTAAHPGYSTEHVRKYREDEEKRERDRERSRRWKAANRERNRARDRAYDRARRASVPSAGSDKINGSTQIGPSGAPTPPGRGPEPSGGPEHG